MTETQLRTGASPAPVAPRVHRAPVRSGPGSATRLRPVAVRRPVPVSPPAGAPGRVRLTRRGRVTLLVMVVIALLVALSAGRVMSSAATPGSAGQPTHTYVVEPGDTAWSIARTAMPGVDGRLAVDRLLAMNHSDGQLRVGQALVVPGA